MIIKPSKVHSPDGKHFYEGEAPAPTHQPNNVSAAGVLMPCPFCGATPDLPDALGTQYEIECDCGMARSAVQISDLMTFEERQSGWDSFMLKFDAQYVERAKEEAIAAWNRRAAASDQATGQAVDDDSELKDHLINRMSKLLAEIALILDDDPKPLRQPSYHDLPDKVRAIQCEVELHRSRNGEEMHSHDLKACENVYQLMTNGYAAPSPAAREAGDGVTLTDEQREAIEYAVRWMDENVSNRYAHIAAKEMRALLREAGSR